MRLKSQFVQKPAKANKKENIQSSELLAICRETIRYR